MAEDDKKAAKQRAFFFTRAERMKKEPPQNPGPAEPFAVFKSRSKAERAEAHVDMQFKQQQFDQIAEHRRQTSRLREQHRQRFDLIFSRLDPKEDRLRREIKTLHDHERQALKEFDAKRKSRVVRITEIVKGKDHFDTQRVRLTDNFRLRRKRLRDELRALPSNFLTVVSEQHHRHVRERLAMMQTHRQARLETQQQHERDRPRLVAERLQAVERNAEIERGHKQDRTKERGSELGRGA